MRDLISTLGQVQICDRNFPSDQIAILIWLVDEEFSCKIDALCNTLLLQCSCPAPLWCARSYLHLSGSADRSMTADWEGHCAIWNPIIIIKIAHFLWSDWWIFFCQNCLYWIYWHYVPTCFSIYLHSGYEKWIRKVTEGGPDYPKPTKEVGWVIFGTFFSKVVSGQDWPRGLGRDFHCGHLHFNQH